MVCKYGVVTCDTKHFKHVFKCFVLDAVDLITRKVSAKMFFFVLRVTTVLAHYIFILKSFRVSVASSARAVRSAELYVSRLRPFVLQAPAAENKKRIRDLWEKRFYPSLLEMKG